MDDAKKIESMLRSAVFPILIFVYLFQFFACRGLFADGADCLVNILKNHGYAIGDFQRFTNHLIQQTPTVILVKLGVRDMVFLRYFFSGWLLLAPLLVWGAALWKVKDDVLFWPAVLIFCFVYFKIDFFAIGESDLCLPLVVFCCVFLMRPLPAGMVQRGALLAVAALLPFHYPSTLFLGPLLLLLMVLKPQGEWQGVPHIYKYALAFLFAASAFTALWGVLAPKDTANFANAQNPAYVLNDAQFRWVLLYAVAASALFFAQKPWQRYGLFFLCTALLWVIIIDPIKFFPFMHYALRAYVAMALAVCGIGLWWFDRRLKRAPITASQRTFLAPAVLTMVLLLTLSWFDVRSSLDYANYLQTFRMTVNNRTGIIPYARSGLPFVADEARFKWDWTYPLLSLLLRDNSQKAIIQNPAWYHGDKDFHPETDIPDFDEYYR